MAYVQPNNKTSVIDIIAEVLQPDLGWENATNTAVKVFLILCVNGSLKREVLANGPPTLKTAQLLLALDGIIDALVFYANPASYFATSIVVDQPAGEFVNDVSPLTEDDLKLFNAYREKTDVYHGKLAREALNAWIKARNVGE